MAKIYILADQKGVRLQPLLGLMVSGSLWGSCGFVLIGIAYSLQGWDRDEMAASFQRMFSNAFSRKIVLSFRLNVHCSLYLIV